MRKTGLAILALAILALALAPVATAGDKKTHDLTVTVVSVDMQAKKITVKNDKGEEITAPVLDSAMEAAKEIKAGDTVTLTCLDTEKGDHEGVSAIKHADAAKK